MTIDVAKAEESQDEVKATLHFTYPPAWLLSHWQAYSEAQQRYVTTTRRRGMQADGMSLKFYGAKALIEGGFVHVTCDASPELATKFLSYVSGENPPLSVIGILNDHVCGEIEAAFDLPLA